MNEISNLENYETENMVNIIENKSKVNISQRER